MRSPLRKGTLLLTRQTRPLRCSSIQYWTPVFIACPGLSSWVTKRPLAPSSPARAPGETVPAKVTARVRAIDLMVLIFYASAERKGSIPVKDFEPGHIHDVAGPRFSSSRKNIIPERRRRHLHACRAVEVAQHFRGQLIGFQDRVALRRGIERGGHVAGQEDESLGARLAGYRHAAHGQGAGRAFAHVLPGDGHGHVL